VVVVEREDGDKGITLMVEISEKRTLRRRREILQLLGSGSHTVGLVETVYGSFLASEISIAFNSSSLEANKTEQYENAPISNSSMMKI